MTVWFTSDLHIGHRWAAGVRFPRKKEIPQAHDDYLAEQWDKRVKRDDVVWVLGDLSMESGAKRAIEWVRERPGTKHLIFGNHDTCHTGIHRNGYSRIESYLTAFDSVQPFARRRIFTPTQGVQEVMLSHFPYRASPYGDHYEGTDPVNRFEQWRLPNMGDWLLHGHTHSSDVQHGRSIHVGVDAWAWHPVPLQTITDIMDAWNPSLRGRIETMLDRSGWGFAQMPTSRTWFLLDNEDIRVTIHADLDDIPRRLRSRLLEDVLFRLGESNGLDTIQIWDDLGEFRS